MTEWLEIVPPMVKEEAERRFTDWKRRHPEQAENLEDIRIDVIRSVDGHTVYRYMLRVP